MSISLWGVLSRFWLGRATPVASPLPVIDVTELPPYLKKDLGIGPMYDFSLPSSFRDRKISPPVVL
jgi:hypothetical protein